MLRRHRQVEAVCARATHDGVQLLETIPLDEAHENAQRRIDDVLLGDFGAAIAILLHLLVHRGNCVELLVERRVTFVAAGFVGARGHLVFEGGGRDRLEERPLLTRLALVGVGNIRFSLDIGR